MMVVKVYMWPGGRQDEERLMAQASFACQGVAKRDDPELGVLRGERAYKVRLMKGLQFRGPKDGADLARAPKSWVWKEGLVRGHRPHQRGAKARGVWDLIGGALGVILGKRLDPYADASAGDGR